MQGISSHISFPTPTFSEPSLKLHFSSHLICSCTTLHLIKHLLQLSPLHVPSILLLFFFSELTVQNECFMFFFFFFWTGLLTYKPPSTSPGLSIWLTGFIWRWWGVNERGEGVKVWLLNVMRALTADTGGEAISVRSSAFATTSSHDKHGEMHSGCVGYSNVNTKWYSQMIVLSH